MKGLKRFTANMIMGANVASIILMLLVGYSDRLNPQEHPMLSCLGLTFLAFLLINVCFLVFWAVFSLKRVIVPLSGFLLCYGPVRTYFPLNLGTAEEANLKVISYNVAVIPLMRRVSEEAVSKGLSTMWPSRRMPILSVCRKSR